MDFEPYANNRIQYGWYRGSLNPDPNDSFAVLWYTRQRERFLASCQEHLDTVLGEVCLLLLTAMHHLTHEYGSKDELREALRGAFPYGAPAQTPLPDLDAVLEAAKGLDSPYQAHIDEGLDALVVDRFRGWRDLPEAEFEVMAQRWLPLLLEQHEHLRGTFVKTANCMGDRAGYGHRSLQDWQFEFLFAALTRIPANLPE